MCNLDPHCEIYPIGDFFVVQCGRKLRMLSGHTDWFFAAALSRMLKDGRPARTGSGARGTPERRL